MPAYRQFRLFTHALSNEQTAQLARGLQHFHDVQNALELVPAGERSLPLHDGQVDFADLEREAAPTMPEITITGVSLVDNWFSHTDVDRALLNIGTGSSRSVTTSRCRRMHPTRTSSYLSR